MRNKRKINANLKLVMETAFSEGVVKINPVDPFLWKNPPHKNPIYNDNRMYLGMPKIRTTILDELLKIIKLRGIKFDGILGVATAGLPWAGLLAHKLKVPLYISHNGEIHQYRSLFIDLEYPELDWWAKVDAIAASIPWSIAPATIMAHNLNKPLFYVRPDKKIHGKGKQIEGLIGLNTGIKNVGLVNIIKNDNYKASIYDELGNLGVKIVCDKSFQFQEKPAELKGKKILVIDDLFSTINSALLDVNMLRTAGAIVEDIACIFTYGFPAMYANIKEANLKMHSLMDYKMFLEYGTKNNYIDRNYKEMLNEWKQDREAWGEKYFPTPSSSTDKEIETPHSATNSATN